MERKADLPVAEHFSSPGHTTDDIMCLLCEQALPTSKNDAGRRGALNELCRRALHVLPSLNKMTRADSNGYSTDEGSVTKHFKEVIWKSISRFLTSVDLLIV